MKYTIGDISYTFMEEYGELWIRGLDYGPMISTDYGIHALFKRVLELEDNVANLKSQLSES